MSVRFEELKNEINSSFYEIVDIINEIIEHRTESFSDMLEVSEDIHKSSEQFVSETGNIVGTISSGINKNIDSLNMDQMKQDIGEATKTFISITEELELLSYNTICRTMALGDKGATITHISKEIKKYSNKVKELLELISGDFNEMFARFKDVSDHLLDNDILPDETDFDMETVGELVMTSDASILIENSQFHDIFMQELEIINEALSNTDFSNAYEAGVIFGVYEKAMTKLDFIKHSIQEKLYVIKDILKDFIYEFNTDLQNIASQTNILRSELNRVNDMSGNVCSTISMMKGTIEQSNNVLRKTKVSVDLLAKQSKTFRNLVVITAVEVARINDESLRSVVVSMSETEAELNGLIDKLYTNIDMWSTLRSDFIGTFSLAEGDMNSLCSSGAADIRNRVIDSTKTLDGKLNEFRKVFKAEKYVDFFIHSTDKLIMLFESFNEGVQESFAEFNERMTDEILSDEEFTNGRNDADIKDILAEDQEQSTVEFF